MSKGLLDGVVVLDLTRVLAGPYSGMILADMGATVIKLENPKGGDDTRKMGPFINDNSVYYANFNRSKLGCTLNLKDPEGKEIFKELVKKADIVVENYRPGVMDKLGLGYDVLKEINPRIIYAAVSGFGCYGPYMTTTVSYKVHKTVYKPKDEWQIIPNTQPAIIDEDTWKRVQELRENRIRPTATGRTSLFSGKVFCADCGSKLHFCAAKSLNANQEHYRCANYKSGRGNCQIHYIRNVVLEKIVLEAINSLADFVRCYEPVFLYLMAQKDIVSKRTETNRLKSSIESGKRRIQDLDKLIERIYEDQVLGNISAERYARMSVNYENEQRELVKRVDEDEKRLVSIEQTSLDLKTLLKVLRSNTAFEELTPTLVNSLIRRIEVHNNDKSSGHCSVKVDIYFTAIGLIDIPTEDEIKSLMEKIQSNPQEYRLTA